MYVSAVWLVMGRIPVKTVVKNEEEEFAKGPLSILYQAVKNNTKVGGGFGALFDVGAH